MENRKTLHDYSLVLILLTALDIFSLISNTITNYLNGVYDEALATVEPNLLTAVKVCLIVFFVLEVILIVSQILIGCKGLKVSRTPVACDGRSRCVPLDGARGASVYRSYLYLLGAGVAVCAPLSVYRRSP